MVNKLVKVYCNSKDESSELLDCAFNFGHTENGKWVKKKCHVNCNCEFATFGICNDDIGLYTTQEFI